jgi:predicted nucleotidyltransferase
MHNRAYDYLIAEALERRRIFQNLDAYLRRLKELVLKVDPKAELYIFGSVAENRYNYSSDVDVLVVSEVDRLKVLEALAREEFTKVLEVHVRRPEDVSWYRRMAKLVRI